MTDHVSFNALNQFSTAPLAAGTSFTGPWQDARGYINVRVRYNSDVPLTMFLDWSDDQFFIHTFETVSTAAAIRSNQVYQRQGSYLRLRYSVPGAGAQTSMNGACVLSSEDYMDRQGGASTININLDRWEDMALGRVKGKTYVDINASLPPVGVGSYTFWGGGANVLLQLTRPKRQNGVINAGNAYFVRVLSTNLADDAAGAGARRVFVEGLDNQGNPINDTFDLVGAGSTVNSLTRYNIVTKTTVLRAGTFNGGCVSFISVKYFSDAGVDQGFADFIQTGEAWSQTGVYTVPQGKVGFLNAVEFRVEEHNAPLAGDVIAIKASTPIDDGTTGFFQPLKTIFGQVLNATNGGFVQTEKNYGPLYEFTFIRFDITCGSVKASNGSWVNGRLVLVDEDPAVLSF